LAANDRLPEEIATTTFNLSQTQSLLAKIATNAFAQETFRHSVVIMILMISAL
jgi:hypothetical protein